ncbi:endonuclease domain-containing protein [Alienimonas chondri]|uniref:DUF559 domain-containing protein n=1 Tax=Alienimonas chondri TaxID=2681879 RepID=A0ABX1VJY1_9PLAN|nr:endonuclease domain-containing protein [Alienimonas chondri]NNJ28179.1 hypothetical protein [Alienimonas chondri]
MAVPAQEAESRTARARRLRRDAPRPERRLWTLLRDRRLKGLKFRRQHPIGPFYADFCCLRPKLVVEVDGASHDGRGDSDHAREAWIRDAGFAVLRVSNDDVLRDPEAVLIAVARAAGQDVSNWQ